MHHIDLHFVDSTQKHFGLNYILLGIFPTVNPYYIKGSCNMQGPMEENEYINTSWSIIAKELTQQYVWHNVIIQISNG